ncbi:SET domain-containing protein [Gammaproteobacteria bacterium AB-CW1]|uniref:SET domain-containing protein n=1 Tax=Natronospira elongata TaxID=3110268 RepID=A0AAP6MK30_9GAMM|nr:SET domain-containing protein [Gammaproteobacteria bacterium AB-CW1]
MSKKYNEENPLVYCGPSPIHGKGLFARKQIAKGTHIGSYEGPETQKDGMHVLWVYDENDENPVGRNGKNVLRFCNHSSRPNAEFDGFELYAIRRIRKDEEITFHYGEDWDDDE